MAGELSSLLARSADLQRRVAGAQRPGVVREVVGDMIRVEFARDPAGNPVLSPWLHTSDHRGGARERRFYCRGQNVSISTVNGQVDEASTVLADAPSEAFRAPDHADDAGPEAETYQLGELHVTKKGDLYEIFFGQGATKFRVDREGNLIFVGQKALFDAPKAQFTGDVEVNGQVKAHGEMTAMSETAPVNLSTHATSRVQSGGGVSGPPVPNT